MPRLSLALVTVLAALALGGCLRFDSDLTLSKDDTVTGRFIVAVEEGQGERLGTDDRTMSEDIWSDYPSAATLADATIRDYSGDGFVGIEVSFADEPLASFAPTAESWGITRVGDEFIVSGPSNSTSATEGLDDALGEGAFSGDLSQLENAHLAVSVTFPGDVATSNGSISGTTVTWDLQDGPATLEARGSAIAKSDPAESMAYIMLGVIALGATAYALAGKVARRQRGR